MGKTSLQLARAKDACLSELRAERTSIIAPELEESLSTGVQGTEPTPSPSLTQSPPADLASTTFSPDLPEVERHISHDADIARSTRHLKLLQPDESVAGTNREFGKRDTLSASHQPGPANSPLDRLITWLAKRIRQFVDRLIAKLENRHAARQELSRIKKRKKKESREKRRMTRLS